MKTLSKKSRTDYFQALHEQNFQKINIYQAYIMSSKLQDLKISYEKYVNENTKKMFTFAIGLSIVGLSASLFYQRFIFPRMYPLQFEYKKMKSTINKIQSNQKSIIQLSIIKRIKICKDGIVFNFSVLKDLDKKPLGSSRGQTSNPFLPPFEDGLFVQELSKTHTLLFNKYAVVKNHMLVVTTQFEYQNSLINQNDFSAAHKVLLTLKGFWFFNSGPDAGASQQHKHMQVMPYEARADTPILNILHKRARKQPSECQYFLYEPFQFKHIIKVLRQMQEEESVESYGEYLQECYIDCMKILKNLEQTGDSQKIKQAYNMIVMDNFMLIVIRKQEKTESSPYIAINGMGFTGSFLLKSFQEIQKNDHINPFDLLKEVCVEIDEKEKIAIQSQYLLQQIENQECNEQQQLIHQKEHEPIKSEQIL
ncbi:ATP adenylyltransferase (macronuclear) [Tetrahymena thermophila SB210]|uniref:ATP adenylyltransferase n=1 Tax=Tetrahymena thermophila (strain SB210) TaxID=312017 RepID=I7MI26_TETTS|nr:ATP adenylyltransferase [Tetrahymena thermophila SB210]EAS03840.3 ATP adenylyltransferase [Tetrahymena thermophila SB210]|eukprot:XP_001024085.3 ATP adenylyltransferase [Tetrahymena thermophila SB210]